VYQRRESDILRSLDVYPRLERNALVFPAGGAYSNALEGTSRGIELVVTGRSARRLSGWASYAYGRTRQTDVERGETYWADFDQRHTVNVSGVYRLARNAHMGATFRSGSNFPVAGYFVETSGRLAIASARNQVRLPPYARLDLRADREFRYFGGRLNLFAKVQNALNRANRGLAIGSVDSLTGEARGFTDTLLARRVSAGVAFVF
jgi:TonB dependent receptor